MSKTSTPTPPLRRPEALAPLITTDMPKADGVRDTIESIVVALILAFVFRAFVVEAFIIPTGSMAPGLYGRHAQHRCGLCNYPYAYGIKDSYRIPRSNRVQEGTLESPGGYFVRCPNCSWMGRGNAGLNSTNDTRVVGESGDRILVLKWPYDIGGQLLGPKRWDVTVFKDTQDGETNYIKRLVGLPGEVLEIIDGDIYTTPESDVPKDILDALSKDPPLGNPEARRLSKEQTGRLSKLLKIQRKTAISQQSLWMIHYDHDYKPDINNAGNSFNFTPPYWRPINNEQNSGWNAATPLVRYAPLDDREHVLELAGKAIQDWYGYNDVNMVPPNAVNVGDVRLKFVVTPGERRDTSDQSYMTLVLCKGDDEFRTKIMQDGTTILEKPGERGIRRELARGKTEPLAVGRPLEVEYENLDYRVALRVNGIEVVATKDADYSPNMSKLLDPGSRDGRDDLAAVRIAAKGMGLDIRHLTVHRDVFYRSDCELEPWNAQGRDNPFARYPGWGIANNPIHLRSNPPDYFVCGDNSPQSKDGRLWAEVCQPLQDRGDYQHGTVPGDQMIGRAFFVYWPSAFRLSQDTPAFIPNVGRMRLIR